LQWCAERLREFDLETIAKRFACRSGFDAGRSAGLRESSEITERVARAVRPFRLPPASQQRCGGDVRINIQDRSREGLPPSLA
jgi:hypothetical protein